MLARFSQVNRGLLQGLVVAGAAGLLVALSYLVAHQNFLPLAGTVGLGLAVGLVIYWRTGILVCLFLVLVEGFARNYFQQPAILLIKDFGFLLIYARVFTERIIRRQPLIYYTPINKYLIALGVLSVVELLNPSLTSLQVGLIGLRSGFVYIPMAFLLPEVFQNRRTMERFNWAILTLVPLITGYGIFQYYQGPEAYRALGPGFAQSIFVTGGELDTSLSIFRPASTFSYPSQYAIYVLVMLIYVLGLALQTNSRIRTVAWLETLLLVYGLLTSGQRTFFVLAPVAIVMMLVATGRVKFGLKLALPLMASIVLIVNSEAGRAVVDRILTVSQNKDDVIWARISAGWGNTLNGLSLSPFGVGTGMATLGTQYSDSGTIAYFFEGYYGKVGAELGWLGFAIYMLLLLSMGHYVIGRYRSASKEVRYSIVAPLVFIFLIYYVDFIGNAIDLSVTNIFFWFSLGLIHTLTQKESTTKTTIAAQNFGSLGLVGHTARAGQVSLAAMLPQLISAPLPAIRPSQRGTLSQKPFVGALPSVETAQNELIQDDIMTPEQAVVEIEPTKERKTTDKAEAVEAGGLIQEETAPTTFNETEIEPVEATITVNEETEPVGEILTTGSVDNEVELDQEIEPVEAAASSEVEALKVDRLTVDEAEREATGSELPQVELTEVAPLEMVETRTDVVENRPAEVTEVEIDEVSQDETEQETEAVAQEAELAAVETSPQVREQSQQQAETSWRLALIQSFLPSESRGGVGYFTHYLANELVRRGHEVTIFSWHPAPTDALYTVRQLKVGGWLGRSKLARLYMFAWQVARQDFSSFDLIHAQGDDFLLWPSLRRRKPLVRTFQGSALGEAKYSQNWKNRLVQASFYPLEWLSGALAGTTVGISQGTRRHLPFVERVIGQGVDLQAFRPDPAQPKSEQPTILFVGHKLNDRKRGNLLLQEFQRVVRPVLPTAQLWMVCEEKVAQPGVEWFSQLSEAELVALYQRAWVFCLPSAYEGFGRPYIEAMACGTPVVATPNLGANEVLDEGRYGRIVEPEALGEALVQLLKDETTRQELAARGLEWVQQWDWSKVATQYEALYGELLMAHSLRPSWLRRLLGGSKK